MKKEEGQPSLGIQEKIPEEVRIKLRPALGKLLKRRGIKVDIPERIVGVCDAGSLRAGLKGLVFIIRKMGSYY